MRYGALTLILSLTIIFTTSTYRIRDNTIIPIKIKKITFNSYDPYGQLTSYILEELHIRKITVVERSNLDSMPSLRIINASESKVTTYLFPDSKASEYRIILTVQAQILMPDKDYYYPFNIQVYRSLFDNKLKDTEEDFIHKEMHKQAAHQLASKLLNILLLAANNKLSNKILTAL